jgi:hypothetical protein
VESTLADKELGWVELICYADFEFRDPAMETLSAPTASLTGAMLMKQGA